MSDDTQPTPYDWGTLKHGDAVSFGSEWFGYYIGLDVAGRKMFETDLNRTTGPWEEFIRWDTVALVRTPERDIRVQP